MYVLLVSTFCLNIYISYLVTVFREMDSIKQILKQKVNRKIKISSPVKLKTSRLPHLTANQIKLHPITKIALERSPLKADDLQSPSSFIMILSVDYHVPW